MAKPGGLSVLLGGAPARESDEPSGPEASADYEVAKTDAAGAVLSAMKANDREAFASALSDFVQLCME